MLFGAAVALMSSVGTAIVVKATSANPQASIPQSEESVFSGQVYRTGAAAPETDFTTAAENTINGVVSIKSFATRGGSQEMRMDPLFEFFFGSPQQGRQPQQPREQQRGLGSGVIISSDGYIVTNNHVIDEAERLEITLNDNRTFDATVIGTDPTTDLALIKIDASDLPVIPMGDSESLRVGEWVLAVGNPFGFTSTVTTGIVSAKSRSIGATTHSRPMGIESYIQTDAAVNPGNSGGALVTLDGQLIGINTAIYSQTGNYAGYSFAIPTSIVKKVVADLRQYGAVQRAVLGVSIRDLTSETAREKGITLVTKGVYIGEVHERSAALEAGLREGDIIVSIDGAPTDNTAQLQEQMAKHKPGDRIKIEYVRDNKLCSAELKLYNGQGNTEITRKHEFASLGCSFDEVDEKSRTKLGIKGGVKITSLKNGPIRSSGIREGFIITSINNIEVSAPADVEKIYNSIMRGNSDEKVMIIRGLYPGSKRGIYAVDLLAD